MADVSISIGVVLSELKAGLAQGSSMLDDFTKQSKKAREGVMFFSSAIRDIAGATSPAGTALSSLLAGFAMGGPMGLAIAGVQGLIGVIKESGKAEREAAEETAKAERIRRDEYEKTATAAARARFVAAGGSGEAFDADEARKKPQAEVDKAQKALDDARRTKQPDWYINHLEDELAKVKEHLRNVDAAEQPKVDAANKRRNDEKAGSNKVAEAARLQAAKEEDQRVLARVEANQRILEEEANLHAQIEIFAAEAAKRQEAREAEKRQKEKEALQARAQTYAQWGERIGEAMGAAISGSMTPLQAVGMLLKDVMRQILQTAISQITTNATVAGSEAAKSQAGIPGIGPALAVTAMTSMIGVVMGLLSSLPSAAGGWEVPNVSGGILSIVHGGEKILPRSTADRWDAAIDAMLEGRAAEPSQTVVNNYYSIDMHSFAKHVRKAEKQNERDRRK